MGTFAITPTAASYQRPSASDNLPAGPCEEGSEAASTIDWRGKISYSASRAETIWSLGPPQQLCSSVDVRPFAGGHVPPFSVVAVVAVEKRGVGSEPPFCRPGSPWKRHVQRESLLFV